MRSFILSFILLLIVSCTSNEKKPDYKRVIIAGKVVNPDPMKYKIDFSINRIGQRAERISPELAVDGSFKVVFQSYVPLDVWLHYKKGFLVLAHPGDSIYVEIDGTPEDLPGILKSVKFKGDASKLNTEAAAFQYMYYSSDCYTAIDQKFKAVKLFNEIDYKRFRDSLRTEEQKIFHKFISDFTPLAETKSWAKIYLDVDYYRDLMSYPEFHRMGNKLKRKDWEVPLSYYEFLSDFHFNDSALISSFSIAGFVNFYPVYVNEKLREENKAMFNIPDYFKTHPGVMDSLRFFGTFKYSKDRLLKEMVLTEILNQNLVQSDTRMFKKYYQIISESITKPYLKEPLFDSYLQTTKNLKDPVMASDAILKKINGTYLESSIKKIFAENRGKVIYVDCWATWCGPCMSEMPDSKKLMKAYKKEDVAFIYICLDSEEKIWKAAVSKYSLSGQHFFLTKDQSSEFRNIFKIHGVPHYILIDKKGNISENGTQSPLYIKEKLDKLLAEE